MLVSEQYQGGASEVGAGRHADCARTALDVTLTRQFCIYNQQLRGIEYVGCIQLCLQATDQIDVPSRIDDHEIAISCGTCRSAREVVEIVRKVSRIRSCKCRPLDDREIILLAALVRSSAGYLAADHPFSLRRR